MRAFGVAIWPIPLLPVFPFCFLCSRSWHFSRQNLLAMKTSGCVRTGIRSAHRHKAVYLEECGLGVGRVRVGGRRAGRLLASQAKSRNTPSTKSTSQDLIIQLWTSVPRLTEWETPRQQVPAPLLHLQVFSGTSLNRSLLTCTLSHSSLQVAGFLQFPTGMGEDWVPIPFRVFTVNITPTSSAFKVWKIKCLLYKNDTLPWESAGL